MKWSNAVCNRKHYGGKSIKTCTNFRQRYGTFKDLKLIEVYSYNEAKITISFKTLYTKAVAKKEPCLHERKKSSFSHKIDGLDWCFQKKVIYRLRFGIANSNIFLTVIQTEDDLTLFSIWLSVLVQIRYHS
jgi:hypothetical protein